MADNWDRNFIFGTDHIGTKFVNTIPFLPLPECTDKVYWKDIEGGNHERFGPYRMYQLEAKPVELRESIRRPLLSEQEAYLKIETLEGVNRSLKAQLESLEGQVEKVRNDWRAANDKLREENIWLRGQLEASEEIRRMVIKWLNL